MPALVITLGRCIALVMAVLLPSLHISTCTTLTTSVKPTLTIKPPLVLHGPLQGSMSLTSTHDMNGCTELRCELQSLEGNGGQSEVKQANRYTAVSSEAGLAECRTSGHHIQASTSVALLCKHSEHDGWTTLATGQLTALPSVKVRHGAAKA